MTTQKPISKSPISDACVGQGGCWQYGSTSAAVFGSAGRFSKSQPPRRVAFSAPSSLSQRATGSLLHTGKEKDSETGYSHFSASFLDHELMTMWLSVDPMADKYPSLSPYAYCVWNSVKLVDPDGQDIVIVIWATTPNNDGVGHAGIAVSNYKVENGKMVPDGTFTYYDNWPGGDGVTFDLKGAIKTVGTIRSEFEIESTDEFFSNFLSGEDPPPDGVLLLSTSYEQDMAVKNQLQNANENKEYYNGAFYNCSSYVSDGLSALFGKMVGKETIIWPFQSITPNQLWNDVQKTANKQGIRNTVLNDPGELTSFGFRESLKSKKQ